MSTTFTVRFGDHVPLDLVKSMVQGMAGHGDIDPGASDRDFSIKVHRASRAPKLKMYLAAMERFGHARWSEISN